MTDIDVVALGELLIDFTPGGKGETGNPLFEMNPGGAPVNCLAVLAKLGARTAFIGTVGTDHFGDFLRDTLVREDIGTEGLLRTGKAHTTLAFVHLNDDGERNFSFLRKPGADTQLEKDAVDISLINRARILHFGSLSLTDDPARETTLFAVRYAKERGKTISYDPNYRPLLWPDEDAALYWMKKGLEYADIVKMSEEEMILLTGFHDLKAGAEAIREMGPKLVLITLGGSGAYYYAGESNNGYVPGYSVSAVDTTGCGDAFTGAMLYQLLYTENKPLSRMVQYANAVGALCATKKGGLPAMPGKPSVEAMIG